MQKEKIIIVDMINGFINEGALSDKNIIKIVPNIKELINRKKDAQIIFLRDCHLEKCNEFNYFPPHCLISSSESEIIDELKYLVNSKDKDTKVILKNSTNGFYKLKEAHLVENDSTYYITGCCYDICVLDLALALITYFNEYNLNSKVIVINDACDTYNSPMHEREKYIEFARKLLELSGVMVKNLSDIKE